MTKRKQKNQGRAILLTLLGFVVLAIILMVLLRNADIPLLQPKGEIAEQQLKLSATIVGILLLIAIPSLSVLYFTVWKYREKKTISTQNLDTEHGKLFVPVLWAVPLIIAVIIGTILWPATHRLEPKKTIASDNEPLLIKVVAMRWKWVFIYPEQKIATVNFMQIPIDTPIQLDLTADEAPMNSFWIPNLGGQLYAMTGHLNRLNLIASTPGDYPGRSPEINGKGFAGMTFVARVGSEAEFNSWLQEVRSSKLILNSSEYEKLLSPSENHAKTIFSDVDLNIYDNILMKYSDSHNHNPDQNNEDYNEHGTGH
ncbi:MAG: COX aromatic rich motif-containing protein [bacterium]|nr:COX aromatic rich motif-containing protein [bacterium]